MAFIAAKTAKNMVGQIEKTSRDIHVLKGTLTKGSLVLIIGHSSRGFDIRDVESGEEFIECGCDCIEGY